MPHQTDLFSGDAPHDSASSSPGKKASGPGNALTALKFVDGKLSPEQLRFNKLLAKTETLARRIEDIRQLADAHRPLHASSLRPLGDARNALMREMALWLDARLQRKGLSARQKDMVAEMICALAIGPAMAGDEAMQQLHEAHGHQSLAEEEKRMVDDMQQFMHGMFGTKVGDGQEFTSMEEMLRATLAQAQAHDEAQKQARASRQEKRKKTARQLQQEQQTQEADGALRTIYRQLVSALHPDRESDPHEQQRKTGLMKEVNAAYERRDLLALLQLQLRADLADGEQIAHLARGKIASLTLLLKERATLLERELQEIEAHAMAEFEMPFYATLSAAGLHQQLLAQKRQLEDEIAMMKDDLQLVQDDTQFKRWLRDQHKMNQNQHAPGGFDLRDF